MAVYFLDSSAVAKHYVAEKGSAWVTDLLNPSAANQLYMARISGVEVLAAIARRVRAGNLTPQAGRDATEQFRADFGRMQDLVDISEAIIARAMDLAERHALRGYDAVQLAAALEVHEAAMVVGFSATVVSADGELNAAATAEGLQVEDPNRHS